MTTLNLDQLFVIAEASPLLEQVQEDLRQSGYESDAKDMVKFQQDAGVQINREMFGYDENEPSPGAKTAQLDAAYEPVTIKRLEAFKRVQDKIPAGDTANHFAALLQTLDAAAPPQSDAKPKPGKPAM